MSASSGSTASAPSALPAPPSFPKKEIDKMRKDGQENKDKSCFNAKLAASILLIGASIAASYYYFPEQTLAHVETLGTLAANIAKHPMENGLSLPDLMGTRSVLGKLSTGKELLNDAIPAYAPKMLNVQTTLLLLGTTLSAISSCASCLKSKKISIIAKAGAYAALSAMLLGSYQYLNIAYSMGNSMGNNSSNPPDAYANCSK
ncbi:MAG: hypothetical protein K1060chlam3_00045 [Candidatus Anoxychlamydiales bacterium]|nr:hypothetical protein [Candidatus Anoxychlamydiales bacterium]